MVFDSGLACSLSVDEAVMIPVLVEMAASKVCHDLSNLAWTVYGSCRRTLE